MKEGVKRSDWLFPWST